MKSRERKAADLTALTDQFKNSKSAMFLSFTKLSVEKDQQFRNELRETGATYKVVKNTLARLAVKDTPFENATEHFSGVTSVAWTNDEPMGLSKVIAKYLKDYKDIFEFKTGVVEGRVVDLGEVTSIASLPSKDELIGKLLFLLNAPAQRLATVLNAVPRDLAVVVKQVSERQDGRPDQKPEVKEAAPAAEEDKQPEVKEAAPVAEEKKPEPEAKAEEDQAKAEDPKTDEQPSEGGTAEKKAEEQADAAAETKEDADKKPASDSDKGE